MRGVGVGERHKLFITYLWWGGGEGYIVRLKWGS